MQPVRVVKDRSELADTACELIAEHAAEAIGRGGRFTALVSGGSTPRPVYRLLASASCPQTSGRTGRAGPGDLHLPSAGTRPPVVA